MIYNYKVNIAGSYHIENNKPCQDSIAIKSHEKFTIAACADGLGSELFSDVGSLIAAQTSVNYCLDNLSKSNQMNDEEIKAIINNSFVYALKAIFERAKSDSNDFEQYDTTLCLAIYDGQTIYYGQSGDSGLVVLLQSGKYLKVTEQQRDMFGNVFPLRAGPEKWEFGKVDQVSSVLLMTDGIFDQVCPYILKEHEININIPLAKRFLDKFDNSLDDLADLERSAYDYLHNYPIEQLNDDKSIIVLINPDNVPQKLSEDYYQIPDWEGIYQEISKKLFGETKVVI